VGVVWAALFGALIVGAPRGSAGADPVLPLPPPPSLPATTPPAAIEPLLVVAGPTVGAVCGTVSLGALLAPSLAEGFFKIPLEQIVSGHRVTQYVDTALYVCGFIPSPLTATECRADAQVIDALRGLNPLVAQIVGLYPEGATVDTVIDIEQLLPAGPSLAQPVADALASTLQCTRAAGVPPVPLSTGPARPRPAAPAPAEATPAPSAVGAPPLAPPALTPPTAPAPNEPIAAAAPPATPSSPLTILETRLLARHGPQWLAILIGLVLLAAAAGSRLWARGQERP